MSVVYGNAVKDRRVVDTYSNYYTVDCSVPFTKDTSVTEIEFYAKKALPIQFIIYRPTGANLKYDVIDKTPLVTPTVGVYKFKLETPMQATKGDMLGWYVQKYGVIPFDYDSSGKTSYTRIGGGITAFIQTTRRLYSVRVVEQAPPPPTEVNSLINGADIIESGSPASNTISVGDIKKNTGDSSESFLLIPGGVDTPDKLESTGRKNLCNCSIIACVLLAIILAVIILYEFVERPLKRRFA